MKKGLMITLVFILFTSFTIVSSASCGVADDNQLIMKLSDTKNAHVSNWNDTIYTTEICYNDFFAEYTGSANPHVDNGMNTVVNTYSSSNSHASNGTDEIFTSSINYGNLQCVFDDSTKNDCSASLGKEGKLIARAFRKFNTHLALPSETSYTTKLCCANVYWAGLDGKIISEADFGDTIYLVSPNGFSSDFEIKEEDFGLNPDDKIRANIKGYEDTRTGNYITKWTIEQVDLDKTRDFDDFYFKVDGVKSTILKINLASNNDPTVLRVVEPNCGDYFEVGEEFTINVAATDSDDEITGKIVIRNNTKDFNETAFVNGGTNIKYTFDSPGEFQVIMTANNSRGENSRAISNIMILDLSKDGDYAAACIASPEDYSDFDATKIFFDASTTRGYKVRDGVPIVQIPGTHPFIWNWTFMGDGEQTYVQNWNDAIDGFMENQTYNFSGTYNSGSKSARLSVSLP